MEIKTDYKIQKDKLSSVIDSFKYKEIRKVSIFELFKLKILELIVASLGMAFLINFSWGFVMRLMQVFQPNISLYIFNLTNGNYINFIGSTLIVFFITFFLLSSALACYVSVKKHSFNEKILNFSIKDKNLRNMFFIDGDCHYDFRLLTNVFDLNLFDIDEVMQGLNSKYQHILKENITKQFAIQELEVGDESAFKALSLYEVILVYELLLKDSDNQEKILYVESMLDATTPVNN